MKGSNIIIKRQAFLLLVSSLCVCLHRYAALGELHTLPTAVMSIYGSEPGDHVSGEKPACHMLRQTWRGEKSLPSCFRSRRWNQRAENQCLQMWTCVMLPVHTCKPRAGRNVSTNVQEKSLCLVGGPLWFATFWNHLLQRLIKPTQKHKHSLHRHTGFYSISRPRVWNVGFIRRFHPSTSPTGSPFY